MDTKVCVSKKLSSESGYLSCNEIDQISTDKHDTFLSQISHRPASPRTKATTADDDASDSTSIPLLDDNHDIDAGAMQNCDNCLRRGHVVHMIVKVNGEDKFMTVNNKQQIVAQNSFNPDNQNVLFTLQLYGMDFGIILQSNSSFQGGVVGVENFTNTTPLTLQSQNGHINNHVLYLRGTSNGYHSLCLRSLDNEFYYVLPSTTPNELLRIYSIDQLKKDLKNKNAYVFKPVVVRCPNSEGACVHQRLTS